MIPIDPYRIREIVAMFVDMHHGEIADLNLFPDVPVAQDTVMEIISTIKRTSFANMKDEYEFTDWIKVCIKTFGDQFSAFVSKGYEFLMYHVYSVYGTDVTSSLRDSIRLAIENARVPRNLVEYTQPTKIELRWNEVFQQHPYMVFILILRNTYIDCGESNQEPSGDKQQ